MPPLLSPQRPRSLRRVAAGQALAALVSWLTHAGQAYAAPLGYVPLPPAIQQLAATALARVVGPGGGHLSG